jgi:hypothetical protein
MSQFASIDRLEPGESFDSLVDSISAINEGAANIFRFDQTTGQFDRILTSFKDVEGVRIGASRVELGLIGIVAVDVGQVDDLNRINSAVTNRAVALVLALSGPMAVAGVVVMFFVFRPLNRLISVATNFDQRPCASNSPGVSWSITNTLSTSTCCKSLQRSVSVCRSIRSK